jgi:gas vesicle protein
MPDSSGRPTYYEVLTAAIADIDSNGYDSAERIEYWAEQIKRAAERSMKSMEDVERMVRDAMAAVFRKQVDLGGVLRLNPGVKAFTLERIRPSLHAELSRRVAASIDLIRLNRPTAIAKAQARFRGWATSIPSGGAPKSGKARTDKVKQKTEFRKSVAQMPFEERRVLIDQSQKLFSAINTIVAVNGGAIGAVWHSHKAQRGYDGRKEHNARDGKFFLVRDSWAHKAGLVKPSAYGYTDDIEQPGEFVFCRCYYQYVYSLRSVPSDALTARGVEALAEARRKVTANARK